MKREATITISKRSGWVIHSQTKYEEKAWHVLMWCLEGHMKKYEEEN